jgi:hypothetical protein
MPKLLLFAPCDKAIIDTETNMVSLVAVIESIQFARAPNVQVPPNAMLPIKWDIVTCWEREPEDHGVEFRQRIRLIVPDNQSLFENEATWQFETLLHRTVAHIYGFPFTAPGLCRLNLSLLRPNQEWIEIASFPIQLTETIGPPEGPSS